MRSFSRMRVAAMVVLMGIAMAAPAAMAQSSAPAQPGGSGGRAWQRGGMNGFEHFRGEDTGLPHFLMKQLNLSVDQTAQVKQISANHKPAISALEAQLGSMRHDLELAEQGSAAFDEDLATASLTKMATVEAKLMGERFNMHKEVMDVLTPEQKTQLTQIHAQMKARFAPHQAPQAQ